jgi:hypothetical protein
MQLLFETFREDEIPKRVTPEEICKI